MEYKNITELAYTYIGLVTTMTKHYVENGVPLIFNSSIKINGIDLSKPVFLDYEFAEKNKNRMHRKNDIVTVHTGDIGVSAIIPSELDGSLGFATIVTRINNINEILPEYLCAFLNYGGGKEQLYKYSRDARNNLNLTDYNRLIVPVPDIKKQEDIVNQIQKFNKIIENNKQKSILLDELVKARFVEMFGNPFDSARWIVKKLKDISESMIDGSNVNPDYYESEGEVLFLRIQNVWRNEFRLEDSVYIPQDINKEQYYDTSLKTGDLLITKIGRYYTKDSSLGRVSVYRGKDDSANYSNNIMRVRLKGPMNSEFVNTLLNLDDYQSFIKRTSKGGTDKRALSKSLIGSYPIIMPPKESQDEFAEFIKQVDKSKFIIQKQRDETQKLFDKLMQDYFG